MLLGLIGHPVSHSLSPAFHNAALRYCGIDGDYRLFDIAETDLKAKLPELVLSGLSGFNVTIPHKTAVYALVGELTPEAKLIGAVNTIKVGSQGLLTGYNTDALGFRAAVEEKFGNRFSNGTAFVLGYGGSAKAVLVALSQLGFAQTYVLGRDQAKLSAFVDQAKERMNAQSKIIDRQSLMHVLPYKDGLVALPDLIVNTIPFGIGQTQTMPTWVTEISEKLPDSCNVVDIVYQRDESLPPFARLLAQRGLAVQDGIEMLVQQARASFEIWTGHKVPVPIMKAALQQMNRTDA